MLVTNRTGLSVSISAPACCYLGSQECQVSSEPGRYDPARLIEPQNSGDQKG